MDCARLLLIPPLVLTAVASALAQVADAAEPRVATTCLGKQVTIVASTEVTVGTDADDVVAMTPLGWSTFDALGGNDTICLALGAASEGGRDPQPPSGQVDAGAGDDVVVDESPNYTGAIMRVGLGVGDDSFTGSDLPETVYTDSSPTAFEEPVPAGTQRDFVATGGGADVVWTSAPTGGLNADRITFGSGTAHAFYVGGMSPDGLLDMANATSASLGLPLPGAAEPLARGELVVDNAARRATVGGAQVLAWSGEIRSFRFGRDAGTSSGLPVSFVGTDADEGVTVAGGPIGDVNLGGGDDALWVEAYNDPFVPRSAHGAAGTDWAAIQTDCLTLTVSLADSVTCDGTTGPFGGFEQVIGQTDRGSSHVTVIGTDASERLVANGDHVAVLGRGGSDVILVDEGWTTRVDGGRGADHIVATGDNVVVRGQGGPDRVLLQGSPGYLLFGMEPPEVERQVATGGRGADVLRGTSQKAADRLIGGRGRDVVDGRGGIRDYCTAETIRRCERP